MEKIRTIEQAIKFLTEKRGFKVEDLRKVKYKVYDEEIEDYYENEEHLINYAIDQSQEELI